METEIVDPWIYTYTGEKVNLLNPDPDTIRVEDIAHALSNIGRWGGHTTFFWSVAQHSKIVSHLCDPEDAMAGLFHDAPEYVLGDICRPLKRSPAFRQYGEIYRNMERVILQKFCGVDEIPTSVKRADEVMLATEASQLMKRSGLGLDEDEWLCDGDPVDIELKPSTPDHARQGFLLRFYRLSALNPGYTV